MGFGKKQERGPSIDPGPRRLRVVADPDCAPALVRIVPFGFQILRPGQLADQ